MRDHRDLKAFALADSLALMVYEATRKFRKEELYGMTSQMRRAAVSIPCNIVEGCARKGEAEFLRFQNLAFSSCKELGYQLTLAKRLGNLPDQQFGPLYNKCDETARVLYGLMTSFGPK